MTVNICIFPLSHYRVSSGEMDGLDITKVGGDNKAETRDHCKMLGGHVGLGHGNVKERGEVARSEHALNVRKKE